MGYIDQFVASVSFDVKKVIQFRKQNAWKTILYLLVFVIVTGAINTFFRWDHTFESLQEAWIASGIDIPDDPSMMFILLFTQYLRIFFDLFLHFILISAIAYAGSKGYQKIGEVSYREAWNVTAYGITAPILVRLVVQRIGLELQVMTFAYWGAIMLFSMMCLKQIVDLPTDGVSLEK